jgi:hypothetical protein
MADDVWARCPGAVGLIAYGSALRGEDPKDTLIDFYVLSRDASAVSASPFARIGCRLLPPNVYYAERAPNRAKYAVMTADQFCRRMRNDVTNPYFWARFAQPVALLKGDAGLVVPALAEALKTLYAHGRGLGGESADAFARAFAETYRTELRSERAGRAAEIVAANHEFYAEAAGAMPDVAPLRANWRQRRIIGKALSLLRLGKAVFTFAGGADYLAWKIARHSGEKIELKPWQRRHPVIAGLLLLPRLIRSGAVR